MKVVIIGAGEVGMYLAKALSAEAIDVIVVDKDENKLNEIREHLDVQTIFGEGSSLDTLEHAGARHADILIAVTDRDEVNMMACVVASVYCRIPRVISRIRNHEYAAEPILLKLGINIAISPEKEAAENILRLLHIPDATEVLEFEKGQVLLVGYKITPDTPLLDKKLKDLQKLRESAVLIAAILRDERVMIPKGDDQILPGDTVYAVTPKAQLPYLKQVLRTETETTQRVMIIGGGIIGEYLARHLEKEHVSIKLIDSNRARCYQLSETLGQTVVLNGDPTDVDFLMEENISEMDACVAVSDDEQMNILVSLLAKRLGAHRTICIVTRSDYVPIATSIGIDSVISPRLSAASAILRFIRQGSVLSVGTLRENEAEAIEVIAQATSSIVNKPIYQTNFPGDAIIAAIIRNGEIIIPQGRDMIIPDDRVIIFTLTKAIKQVEKSLAIKTTRGTRSLG